MSFTEKLNSYLEDLSCSISELSKASGLSEATISRYHNGSRIPNNPSEQLDKLISGLSKLYAEKGNSSITEESIKNAFNELIKSYDIDLLTNHFNMLISELRINISDFSKNLGYDPSYLSKIRAGKRKPSNPDILIDAICNYVVKKYNDDESKKIVASLVECDVKSLLTDNQYKEKLSFWLCSSTISKQPDNNINVFLKKLDDFNLSTYIKAIKFDKLITPTLPFNIPKSKTYYGIEQMKQGELDFLKFTVLSKDSKSVFMCSDMQIDDMAKDLDFGKKWMLGVAMMLKRGLHLDIIHNLDRPFNEMMLGLESWLPIYMTGQVSPYYLPTTNSNIYSHLDYVSDIVCLTGECVKGYHDKGKYYLTKNSAEIEYAKSKASLLLRKAKPLMKICGKSEQKLLDEFLSTTSSDIGDRKIFNSSLPIYTISDDLILQILKRNNVSKKDTDKILRYIKTKKEETNTILKNNTIKDVIGNISKSEFESEPVSLELSELFYEKNIYYTYDEYLEHFNQTKQYSESENYSLEIKKTLPFRNIQITINVNNWVLISKNDNPTIHFIIEHPKLCKAIENFDVPVTENY